MERYRIGRSRDNDIVLENLTVSRQHAEIVCRGDGLYDVIDLGSTVGTFVLADGEWKQFAQATVTGDEPISFGHQKTTVAQLIATHDDLKTVTVTTAKETPRMRKASRQAAAGAA